MHPTRRSPAAPRLNGWSTRRGAVFFGGEDFYWVILVSSQSRVFQPVVSCVLVYILLSLTLLEVMIEILFRPRAERLGTHS